MYELLGIDIKTLDDGGFQFYQNGLIRKVLEAIGVEHCNGLPTPTKFEAPLSTYKNGSEAKRYWPNLYASVIGMILYMASNKIPCMICSSPRWDNLPRGHQQYPLKGLNLGYMY